MSSRFQAPRAHNKLNLRKQAMPFDDLDHCLTTLGTLASEQRLHFFELLAHNLTVAARIVWSEEGLSPTEQVQSLKALNECLHRATARIWVERLQTHPWPDNDFLSLLGRADESLHPTLRGVVRGAFDISLQSVTR